MGRVVRHHVGGIAGLLTAPRAQWEAIESDLLGRGFVLADVPLRVTWRAVKVLVAYAPRDSAVFRQGAAADQRWGDVEQLLALHADLLQLIVWQRTKDGAAGRNQPRPIPRPGDEPRGRRLGNAAIPVTDLAVWLEARRRGELPPIPGQEVS